MKKTRKFEAKIGIDAEPKEVINFLGDFNNLKRLHPMIVRVEENKEKGDYIRKYTITDEVKYWFITTTLEYVVEIFEETEACLKSRTSPGMGIDLVTTYKAEMTGSGCLLK